MELLDRFVPTLQGRKRSESVMLVSLPKSGTDYTNHALLACTNLRPPEHRRDAALMAALRAGYYPEDPRVISVGGFDTQTLRRPSLETYRDRGFLISVHMHASYYNLCTLRDAEFRRVTVLLRDPRDATVSLTHHIRKAGPTLRNLHSEFQFVPHDYFEWDHATQLSYQVRIFLPRAINWIEGWLGAFQADIEDLDIRFALFDELQADPRTYLSRMCRFHRIAGFDLSKLPHPRSLGHFRRGKHDSWRDAFSADDRALAASLMGNRLSRAYARAAAAHRGWRRAEYAAANGNSQAAALSMLSVIDQFPNVRQAYEGFAVSAAACGSPLPGSLRAQIAEHFRSDVCIFRRPHALVSRLQEWARTTLHAPAAAPAPWWPRADPWAFSPSRAARA